MCPALYAQSPLTSFRVAFYNVENLFDTRDNREKLDDDFTPAGRQAWTTARYQTKLDRIGEVVEALEYPALVGLAEIENDSVLAELVASERLAGQRYAHLSFDSPDLRGIDVGLLYRSDVFTLERDTFFRIDFPAWLEPEGYTSRDLLYARLDSGEAFGSFHCFVVHWPSRRGGEVESEHRRLWVAQRLRRLVDELLNFDQEAKVIIMGDFNDEPANRSVQSVLGAIESRDSLFLPGILYNHMIPLDNAQEGTYNYRGNWNMLDQFVTHGLGYPAYWRVAKVGIFKPDWLLYKGDRPNRTYGGPNYYGGYSDHLPIFLDIELMEE
jgi:predicted extracellular nuclease